MQQVSYIFVLAGEIMSIIYTYIPQILDKKM